MNTSSNSSLLKKRLGGRNLYLVGMMGCGKSRTGPYLAEALAYAFVDSDAVIEKVSKKEIFKIFEEEGEDSFRAVESQVLNAIGQQHSMVVATGGGVVTQSENWGVLHQGLVIWIDPGRDRIFSRLKSDSVVRPLLNCKDPLKALDLLISERERYYVEADLHLHVADESAEEVAIQIIDQLLAIVKSQDALSGPQTIAD